MMKTIICLLISPLILISAAQSSPSAHTYIALGDSVSSGYGLAGYDGIPEGVHTALFFEKLKDEGYVDEYHNFATSSFTTTDVLELLNGLDNEEMRLFHNARVITLNIGGNNIASPFLDYLYDSQVVVGGGNVATGAGQTFSRAWSVINELVSGVDGLTSETDNSGFDLRNIIGGIGEALSGFGRMIFGAGEIVSGSPDVIATWRGALSPELETMLNDGVQTFESEFAEIIMWLETNAPNATIIVNTIYNPIPQEILRIYVPLSNWSHVFISDMNEIILQESEQRGFLVTDVNSYLSERLDLTGFNINPLEGSLSLDLVHPNKEGHRLIAELNYRTFMEDYR